MVQGVGLSLVVELPLVNVLNFQVLLPTFTLEIGDLVSEGGYRVSLLHDLEHVSTFRHPTNLVLLERTLHGLRSTVFLVLLWGSPTNSFTHM